MRMTCDGAVCPHDRPRASRDYPGGGMWGRESRCPRTGGMHEVFIQNYEIVRLKLERMCERSPFFDQPFSNWRQSDCKGGTRDGVALAASLPFFCVEFGRRLCAANSRQNPSHVGSLVSRRRRAPHGEPVPWRRRACHAENFGVGGLDINSRK